MMKTLSRLFCVLIGAVMFASCSNKVNTAGSRFWQSFSARYNTFFNGHEAFKEGMQAKEKGAQDNFTEQLPLFMVSNEKNAQLGKSNFETCVEKMQKVITKHSIKKKPTFSSSKTLTPKEKQYRQRKEFNPFLKRAWLLMGQAQFQTGEFEQAAATFNYIIRLYAAEPLVVAEARTWLARCYAQVNWLYDAEDVMTRQSRDSIAPKMIAERDATMADILLRQERYEEALPYLTSTVKHTKRKAQKARLYFLLGQIQQTLGHEAEAYKALGRCASISPTYNLQFNARILQTEMLGQNARKAKSMIGKLKRMARADINKEYLDQVYYAMGNIYMAQEDTTAAISAYEQGRSKSSRSTIEKGVLLLRLGELYWDMRKFDKAQPCYSECISMLGKEHARYQQVMKRSKVLDELVPYTSAVYLQDSLQTLAKLPEAERLEAIDRVIDALKKKEAEERKQRRDSAAQARAEANGSNMLDNGMSNPSMPVTSGDKSWYFYNPQLVSQGKQDFRKQWGQRKNEDDWRRANHTVVQQEEPKDESEEENEALSDSTGITVDSLSENTVATADSLAADPHNREYYLAQIPFTEEQLEASHEIIKDGLYNAGVIEKDKLDDFELAEETLGRLVHDYPDCTQLEDALYHMFLLYSRWQKPDKAEQYKQMLAQQFPESPMTRMITDPEFELLARYGLQMEDSLYTETYQAYRERQKDVVNAHYEVSSVRFPNGLNRPKFMLVHALNNIGTLTADSIISELRQLLKDYPKADVAEMAGMIVKGLESGRTVGDGVYNLGALWERRSMDSAENVAELKNKQLVPDRLVPFNVIIAYPTDSVNDEKLLYEVAHFNFSSFRVRGFELSFSKGGAITQFRVAGFNSYDEAHTYAQKVYNEAEFRSMLAPTRMIIISEENLQLLGTMVSYDEYQKYYDEHFAPLEIPADMRHKLSEPEIPTRYEDEVGTGTRPAAPGNDEEDEVFGADDDYDVSEGEEFLPIEESVPVQEEEIIVTEDSNPKQQDEEVIIEDGGESSENEDEYPE